MWVSGTRVHAPSLTVFQEAHYQEAGSEVLEPELKPDTMIWDASTHSGVLSVTPNVPMLKQHMLGTIYLVGRV